MSTGTRTHTQKPLQLRARPSIKKVKTRKPTTRARVFRGHLSWAGFEKQREELRAAAKKYAEADKVLGEKCAELGCSAVGCTITAYKQKTSQLPEAKAAADALHEMQRIHRELVVEHSLNFDLVHKEWATILNPTPGQVALCDANIDKLILNSATEGVDSCTLSQTPENPDIVE